MNTENLDPTKPWWRRTLWGVPLWFYTGAATIDAICILIGLARS